MRDLRTVERSRPSNRCACSSSRLKPFSSSSPRFFRILQELRSRLGKHCPEITPTYDSIGTQTEIQPSGHSGLFFLSSSSSSRLSAVSLFQFSIRFTYTLLPWVLVSDVRIIPAPLRLSISSEKLNFPACPANAS